jgi:hypothetical protein
MDKAIDKDLYKEVVKDAKKKFKRYPSAYASMWIQKEYQRRGGKYSGKKDTKNLENWTRSKWVQMLPLLKDGKIIECGDDNKDTKVCRPIVRVNKDTPITIQELLELHSVKDLIELAEKKNADMAGRVYWKDLKFISSK